MQEIIPRYIRSGIMVASKEKGVSVQAPNPNVAARRGFIRAVGVAAKELVQPCIKEVLGAVIRSASLEVPATEDEDPGSRVAAVQALVDLSSRPPNEVDLHGMEDAVVQTLVRCIHQDYRLDERGDVGSWVRKEAMLGLEKLLLGESTHAQNQHFRLVGAVVSTEYGQGVIVDGFSERKRKIEEISGVSDSDPLCCVRFEKPALGYYYFGPNGVGLLRAEKLSMNSDGNCVSRAEFQMPDIADRMQLAAETKRPNSASSLPFARRLSPDLVGAVVSCATCGHCVA